MIRVVLLFVLLCSSCHNEPFSTKPVPGNPCGARWVTCSEKPLGCCMEHSVCGADDTCRWFGTDDSGRAAARPPTRQRHTMQEQL